MLLKTGTMMKRFCLALVAFLQTAVLLGHGFSADTLVLLANNAWQDISTVCYRTQKKKIAVASYDATSSYQTTSKTTRGGRSKSNCFIRFGFNERLKDSNQHEVACTPTQEFYNARTHQWIPTYKLKIGEELLCANNTRKTIAYISLIQEPLNIFTIEVKHTHTFFVTQHSLLTHNMIIPVAFSIGMSVPFGASAGGTAGGFFGPVTFVAGLAIGCAVGALVKIVCNNKIPTYSVEAYNTHDFEKHVKQQPQVTTFSEPQVVLSPDYVTTQHSIQHESLSTGDEHIHYDESNQPLFSTTIINPPKEKPGCGDTTQNKPLILVTPADPMPVFQNPGYRPLSDEARKMLSGGCVIIPIPESERESNILFTEEKTAEEVISIINELEKNAKPGEETKGKTKQYIVNGTYDDAVNKFNELTPKNIKPISSNDGKTGFIGNLTDGRTANVRTDSTHGAPTLEIYDPSNGKKLKFRYTPS